MITFVLYQIVKKKEVTILGVVLYFGSENSGEEKRFPPSKRMKGMLLKKLERAKGWLTRLTGYTVKYVEQGGIPLSKLFSLSLSSGRCSRIDCIPCRDADLNKRSSCMMKNIEYEST